MFINANPGVVSNGFETFVPVQIAESLHQRLVEMTNNDVNAWSVFRPVTSTNDNWDQHINDFNSNENFSVSRPWSRNDLKRADSVKVHSLYGGYFQDASSVTGAQTAYLPRTTSYTASRQDQCQPRKTSVPQIYYEPALDMNCIQRASPMLGDPYLQWGTSHGRGSFAEFSSSRCGLKDLSYEASNELDLVASTPASSITQAQPSYIHGNLPSHGTTIDQKSVILPGEPTAIDNSMKTAWWPESSHSANHQYQNTCGLSSTNDGLPMFQNTQQNQGYGDIWSDGSISANTWASQANAASTISPKLLTLDVSPAPMSSSGSSQGTVISPSDSSSAPSIEEDASDFSGPETLTVVEQPVPIRPPRQILPDSLPSPRRALPVLLSDDFNSAQATRKRSLRHKSAGHSRMKIDSSYDSTTATLQDQSRRSELVFPKSNIPKRIEPKPLLDKPSWTVSNQSTATAQAMHHRDAKDDFLVRSKLAGMSYKDIRRQGKFTEAESTLRGRFRILTKHKTARVRKPEWNDNDVSSMPFQSNVANS
jgi:hypothetical protein